MPCQSRATRAALRTEEVGYPPACNRGADRQRPESVQPDCFHARYRHIEAARRIEYAFRDLRTQGRGHGNAAAVVAQTGYYTPGRLVNVGILIPGHRQPSAPGVRPSNASQARPELFCVSKEVRYRGCGCNFTLGTASADQQTLTAVEAIINGDSTAFVENRAA